MHRLRNQDFRDILDLIHLCNSHLGLTEMREAFLSAVERVFRVQRANFFVSNTDLKGIDINSTVSLGIEKRYLERYSQYYYRYDPWWSAMRSGKVVYKTDDALPYPCSVNPEYYEDFLKPQGIHHSLVIFLRSRAKLLGVVGLFRPKGESNFSEEDALKAHILAPHLATAMESITLLSQIEEERNLLRRANELPLLGTLLMDFELRPVYWNSKAKESCLSLSQKRPNGANGVDGDKLPIPPEILEDCLALKGLIQAGSQIASPCRQRIVYAGENQRFRIESSIAKQPLYGASTPYFLVSLEDTSENDKVREEIIKETYYLTKREMEIIRCVSEGLTNQEISEKLFVSRFTVKKHLENIFEKTGVKNRVELTRVIQPV